MKYSCHNGHIEGHKLFRAVIKRGGESPKRLPPVVSKFENYNHFLLVCTTILPPPIGWFIPLS